MRPAMTETLQHSHLLNMLYTVLKEMRTNDHPNYAKAMAQTFHGLPVKLAEGQSAEAIYAHMSTLARENKTLDYLEQLKAHALENKWKSGRYVPDEG